jgi:hypothetical protein
MGEIWLHLIGKYGAPSVAFGALSYREGQGVAIFPFSGR